MNKHVEDVNRQMYKILLKKAKLEGGSLYSDWVKESMQNMPELKNKNFNEAKKLLKGKKPDDDTLMKELKKVKVFKSSEKPKYKARYNNNDSKEFIDFFRSALEKRESLNDMNFSEETYKKLVNKFDSLFLLGSSSVNSFGDKVAKFDYVPV